MAETILGMPDARMVLGKTLDSPRGIRLKFADKKSAVSFRLRLYKARTRDANNNKKLFPEDHYLHNRSVFEKIMISLKLAEDVGEEGNHAYLYLIHDEEAAVAQLNLEEL